MIKFGATLAVLAIAGLAACGDGGGQPNGKAPETGSSAKAGNAGPDRTEGKIEEAKLEEFSGFLPAEVNGWKKAERLGYYSGSNQSTATATYGKAEGGERFTVVITFANDMVRQTRDLFDSPRKAEEWGFSTDTFAGYPALVGKPGTNMAGTPLVILLSNSRMVQAMYNPQGGLTLDTIRPVLEKIDLKGIAEK